MLRFLGKGVFVLVLVCFMAGGLFAQESVMQPVEAPPGYKLLRYDEDYRYLRDLKRRQDFLDEAKYIPLDEAGDFYLSLGGEARERYERFGNYNWGAGPQDDNGYLLERYMLHGDLHLGSHFRVFTQLKSGLEYGRTGGPRPPDRDQLDLNQAFVDAAMDLSEKDSLTLRVGRQELMYGSSRLVSPREGPNVRQSFNAVRAILKVDDWRMDAFVSRPVETNPGVFDNEGDEARSFWGVYATGPSRLVPGLSVDLYYFGLDRQTARYAQGTDSERRHSVGTRIWGKASSWDYNVELVYQLGDFGNASIRAWTAASETGYTFGSLPATPRFSVKADIASGDHNPSNPDLGTFNALFPKGSYFSEADLIGPANIIDLHPALEMHLTDSLTLTGEWDFFWRQSTRDGIYGIAVNPLRSGTASDKRYIGSQPIAYFTWVIERHVTLTLYYSHFFAGPFLEETPPGKDVDFVAVWITFKF